VASICETCGASFEGERSTRRFCSSACRLRAHRQRGREARDDPVFAQLEKAVGRAIQEHVLVGRIASAAARGEWRASARILERRYSERWGRRDREIPPPVEASADPFRTASRSVPGLLSESGV
jgi:hypothetical protein